MEQAVASCLAGWRLAPQAAISPIEVFGNLPPILDVADQAFDFVLFGAIFDGEEFQSSSSESSDDSEVLDCLGQKATNFVKCFIPSISNRSAVNMSQTERVSCHPSSQTDLSSIKKASRSNSIFASRLVASQRAGPAETLTSEHEEKRAEGARLWAQTITRFDPIPHIIKKYSQTNKDPPSKLKFLVKPEKMSSTKQVKTRQKKRKNSKEKKSTFIQDLLTKLSLKAEERRLVIETRPEKMIVPPAGEKNSSKVDKITNASLNKSTQSPQHHHLVKSSSPCKSKPKHQLANWLDMSSSYILEDGVADKSDLRYRRPSEVKVDRLKVPNSFDLIDSSPLQSANGQLARAKRQPLVSSIEDFGRSSSKPAKHHEGANHKYFPL